MRLKIFLFSLLAFAMGGAAHAQDENGVTDVTASPDITYASAATPAADPENTLLLDLSTGGRVTIRLRPDAAPNHVARIKTLTRQGFYNGIIFHRVIDGFMAQTGDPTGTGQGGSQLPDIGAEFTTLPHVRGTVSMARATDPNSANSQFYIMFMPNLGLDRNYTAFGRVTGGMQYVDAIPRGEPPANPALIIRASIAADDVPPPTAAEIAAMTQPAANDQAAALDAALGELAGETPQ
ncbi:peptidylprolyl isomerase [Parasphingopyxis algicola]|uniref:peptidylprolyl isomerase n=1 Tax=Parasphingopyxis algicola TaxID=2026624 RepID=UPI001FE69A4A|nr:peptidylprolyl isomerase [Parasphingopyxis algicola]